MKEKTRKQEKQKNEENYCTENMSTRKIGKTTRNISGRGTFHPDQKGGQEKRRECRMATDKKESSHPNRVRVRLSEFENI